MADAPPPLTLAIGDEELLVDRAVAAVLAAARAAATDLDITDVPAAGLEAAQVSELLSPTLFGGLRCVILRDAEQAGKDLTSTLLRQLPAADDCVIVVTVAGGSRGKALVEGLRDGAAVLRCDAPTSPGERAAFVAAEFHAVGRVVSPAAVTALLAGVGTDLRELANACAQLVADTTGPVEEDTVARYVRGRADATGFAVADRTVEGDTAGALEVLRWALDAGVAPVLVTSSLAANLRLIARVAGEGRGQSARIARALGQPTWKVDKALRWARGWTPAALSRAVRAVAVADGEVKGAVVDPRYAVERAVITVSTSRRGR